MKNLIYIILAYIVINDNVFAQTISPYVINSAGNSNTVTIGSIDYFITSNIGEPIITTVQSGTNIVTQGFLQPYGNRMIINAMLQPMSCKDKNDASIKLDSFKIPFDSYLIYKWFFNGVNICPNADCNSMDSLSAGTYSIVIYALNNTTNNKIDSVVISPYVIPEVTTECDSIQIYSAFSPNGDNMNDTWIIDRIENTVTNGNTVSIYNRWGGLINQFKDYNNTTTVWKGETKSGQDVPAGTYFYVIEIKGKEPKKGWVELMGR